MGTMLHEVLAVEKTKGEAAAHMIGDTASKFGKEHFFSGHLKTLEMINASPENEALEKANRDEKALPTTVFDTLEYALGIWAEAEDVTFTKNRTNTLALADIVLDGQVIAAAVPVDELMGLEARLDKLRGVMRLMPTIDAAKEWVPDAQGRPHVYQVKNPHVAAKTEKVTTPVVLAPATVEHPAQVKEASRDVVVGTVTKNEWSGAVSAVQKSDVLKRMDDMISAVKAARMRANKVEILDSKIGAVIAGLILEPLLK